MKRIGVLSDTHGTWDDRYVQYFSECDEIWHAGDIGDLSVLEGLREICTVRAVYGNIDGAVLRRECPAEQVFEVEGAKILIRHIVGRPGKYSFGISTRLRAERPKILVAGHSHILMVKYDPTFDTLYINPGAAGTYGAQVVRTLIRFTIDQGIPKDLEVIELHSK